jgi:uncharacterized protein (DUF1800 family)
MQAWQQSSSEKSSTNLVLATIATQRFAMGARPDDIKSINKNAQAWLLNQLELTPAVIFDQSLPNTNTILAAQYEFKKTKKKFKKQQNEMSEMQSKEKQPKNPNKGIYKQLTADALKQNIESANSFNWRCLEFFSNHFSVTAQGQVMAGLAPTLEREAIAPNLFGHFEDLLLAVCKHPAMLIYLNNEISIGPSTRFAKKNRGLNENLAREILELHTLGIDGGYKQGDVTELAKGITGWSVGKINKDKQQGFIYRTRRHEPGTRVLMSKRYSAEGLMQGEKMLRDLANHPQTARFISTKIIKSFISDQAPEELINHLTTQWLSSKGHLKTVFKALINHPLAWQSQQQKYKTPREYIVSTYRALAIKRLPFQQIQRALATLGQSPFKAGSPAGYSDQQQDWDGASALMARINWASQLAGQKRLETIDIETLIVSVFGHSLSAHSYQVITRAESRQQALTLLLLCPEFLRR